MKSDKLTVHEYIERHNLYDEGEFCLLYENFLLGDSNPKGRRYSDSRTLDIECQGQLLVARGKAVDVGESIQFVRNVLEWGGKTGNRVRGKLLPKKLSEGERAKLEVKIAGAVEKASSHLQSEDLHLAIKTITALYGLGISYGSKILRMLSPQSVGVFDSFLNEKLRYSITGAKRHDNWVRFCNDCKRETEILHRKRIKNRFRIGGAWYVADVEAVIFRHIDSEKQKAKGKE